MENSKQILDLLTEAEKRFNMLLKRNLISVEKHSQEIKWINIHKKTFNFWENNPSSTTENAVEALNFCDLLSDHYKREINRSVMLIEEGNGI